MHVVRLINARATRKKVKDHDQKRRLSIASQSRLYPDTLLDRSGCETLSRVLSVHSRGHRCSQREPTILQIANSWLILNVGGGPTDDKPNVTLRPPVNPHEVSSFLNIRVADIRASFEQWRRKGAEFLTEPKDHGREIRCYMRDPDNYIIEVGQITAPQA